MPTYAKFPASPSGGGGGPSVAPTNTLGVLTGLGSGTYSFFNTTYAVSNKMMDVFSVVQITSGGDGVENVALQVPGGYEVDDALLYSVEDIGTCIIADGSNTITNRLIAFFESTTTIVFGSMTPITGSDTLTGDFYYIRLRFPVK